jgi:multidrug efflux system membrane fusion protein
VIALIAVLAIGLLLRQRTKQNAAAGAAPSGSASERVVPVPVTTVARRDLPIHLEGLGTVAAFNTVTLKPQVDGRVEKILFKEGDDVKKGDALVQIDARPFAIQAQLARANRARDAASLANARLTLERNKKLFEGGVGSQQAIDDAKAEVARQEAIVASDEAAIASAGLNLDYAKIVSPIDGVVGVRLVDVGNVVHPSDQGGLVVITQVDPIAVFFTLPEDELPRVNKAMAGGKELEVIAFARDGETRLGVGKLAVVDNRIDVATATIRLKAVFPNPERQLWPNQFVKARLALSVRKGAIVVPSTVVQRGPQGAFVYVVNADDTVALRPVTVDMTQGEASVIGKGLDAGERVVVDGQNQLRPGAKIAAKPWERPGASSSGRPTSSSAPPSPPASAPAVAPSLSGSSPRALGGAP